MNITDYKKKIGTKTNIHKVSFFFKKDLEEIKNKRLLIIDFEFTAQRNIFEVGGIILNNAKIEKLIFEEFSVPKTDTVL